MGEQWKLTRAGGFAARLNRFRKRYPKETAAVLVNLDRYFGMLKRGKLPREIRAGFIHSEKKGVIAIDQSGSDGRPTQLRLYIHSRDMTVHLITIGDKSSQQADIKDSHDYVSSLRRKR